MAAYFNLSLQLLFNSILDKLLFVQHLNGNQKFRFLFACKVYMAELSSTKRFSELKIINRPFKWIELAIWMLLLLEVFWVI